MVSSPPLLAATLAAVVALPAVASPRERPAPAAAGTRTVAVSDNRYSPKRLEVATGTRVKWVWSRDGERRHDVYLDKRPDDAAGFRSAPAIAPFTFTRKLRKPGTYKILCTLHEGMRMRIDVKR